MQEKLEIGQIVNTFGIKGQVKVVPFTDDITRFDYLKRVYIKNKKINKQYEVERLYEIGQPVLVGTISVETSERLSKMLDRMRIRHEVLNAKNHAREAEIIAKAGK